MMIANHVRWLMRDYQVRWGLAVAILFSVFQWILFGFYGWRLPPEIPMFYSLPGGSAQLTGSEWFIFLPSLTLVMVVINGFLIRMQQDMLIVYLRLFSWTTALLAFLVTLSMLHTIWLVL